MALIDSLLVLFAGLLLGATGIYISAKFILGEEDFGKAFMTALFGAVVWAVVGFLFGWIPLLGPLITLLAWIGLVNSMYGGGSVNAVSIALVAWLSVLVILYILAVLGLEALRLSESQASRNFIFIRKFCSLYLLHGLWRPVRSHLPQ